MRIFHASHRWIDPLIFLSVLGAAVLLSMALASINDDNNPFAMAVFILAVVLVASATDGYAWGIAASLAGTFCVNLSSRVFLSLH